MCEFPCRNVGIINADIIYFRHVNGIDVVQQGCSHATQS